MPIRAKNHLPLCVANFLTANFLTLLKKPNNSDRPISVGDIFIRLAGGALLYNIRHALPKYMGVTQLGLGSTKGTCELANLISSLFIDFLSAIKECLSDVTDLPQSLRNHIHALFMDLANCYGNINKNVFIQILNDNPDLITIAPYFALVYGAQSTILFFSLSDGRKLLHALDIAKNGLFQGETLAAFIACVVLNHVIHLTLDDFSPEEKTSLALRSIHHR